MSVKTYSLKKDANIYLSKNFKINEFACLDGSDTVLIADTLVVLLQGIRDHFAASVTINSGYRTAARNAAVGGSKTSQHLLGTAADITVKGVPHIEVAQYAEHLLGKSGGIGLYNTFVHVDVRAARSRWDQRSGKQVVVGGWPGYEAAQVVIDPAPAPAVPVRVLCRCGDLLAAMEGIRLNGAIYAPVRQLGEALGYSVEWKEEEQKVIVK